MYWYFKALKQYADFRGRSRRKEYFWFILVDILFSFLAALLDGLNGFQGEDSYGPIFILYFFLTLIPHLSVSVRRLHDVGKSGWMMLLFFIPLIGVIWLLILFCSEGTSGINTYGPNPKESKA